MQQMQEEGRLFQTVDRLWREIMKYCAKDTKVRKIYRTKVNSSFSFSVCQCFCFQNIYNELLHQLLWLSRNKAVLYII